MDGIQKDTPRRESEPRDGPGMPRWVTVLAIVAAVLIVLLLAVVVLGGGQHGPARHLSLADAAGDPARLSASLGTSG